MEKAALSVLRAELLVALSANTDRLRDAMRAELARPINLDDGRPLQFEIDPFFFGIASCATEEALLSDDWLDAAPPEDWFERAETVAGGWSEMISQELCPWFAECWLAVGGPARFSAAFLFFHGYPLQQFDLERRRWLHRRRRWESSPDAELSAAPQQRAFTGFTVSTAATQPPCDWTFVKRQEAVSSLWSPNGASDSSPGQRQRQEPRVPPWVSVPTVCSLSPSTFFVLGERARVRGHGRAHL